MTPGSRPRARSRSKACWCCWTALPACASGWSTVSRRWSLLQRRRARCSFYRIPPVFRTPSRVVGSFRPSRCESAMNLMKQRLHRHSVPRSGSNSCLRNRNDESPRNLWRFSDAGQTLKWRETKLPREKTSSALEQSDCPKPSSGAHCLAGMNGEFSFPGPESGEDSLLPVSEQRCGAGPSPGEGALAPDVGIQDVLQCATRDYRYRTGPEDSQTPVRQCRSHGGQIPT